MADKRVTLVTPNGMSLTDTNLPDDMTVSSVLAELKDQLNLPSVNESNDKILYSLSIENQKRILLADQTLRECGIEDGDTLRMISSTPAPRGNEVVQPPPLPLSSPAPTGKIEVLLSVIDLNKSEMVELESDRSVGELIDDLIGKYPKLLQNGKSGYRLTSKFLGRYLLPGETLGGAGVPVKDRLGLQREEIAGGGYGR
ncbi:MAG: EsaB/YukD family protein [Blastocatellia bacterium]|jgi:uncharacterized ubiquitin-like protein YukD